MKRGDVDVVQRRADSKLCSQYDFMGIFFEGARLYTILLRFTVSHSERQIITNIQPKISSYLG